MFHYPLPAHPPAGTRLPSCVWGSGLFTEDELDRINAYAETLPPKQVQVGRKLTYKPEVNRSIVRWLVPSQDTLWIYQKITTTIAELNSKHYQFDITGMDEPLYHVTYPGDDKGHYDWHVDVGQDGEAARKLSITFQMTDPAQYTGGDLEMNAFGTIEKCPRERGKLILFPSYQVHRVTPVTSGTRSALVAWIGGPPFR